MSGRWWREGLSVYMTWPMALLGALGYASGLPRLLVYSTLVFWLMELGVSVETVGWFALTATPYTLKFLWAPLLDHAPVPWLGARLGRRRSWLLITQLGVMLTLAALAWCDPAASPWWTAAVAIGVAIASASQDVVVDALRVESLAEDEQGAGAAVAVFGYRVGMLVAGAGALALAFVLKDWGLVYMLMAACMLPGVLATLLIDEPERPPATQLDAPDPALRGPRLIAWQLRRALWGPLGELVARPGWGALLAFVMCYKLGDALAGVMLNPMLVSLAFTKLEIAGIAKTYGMAASIGGVFLGGWLVRHAGVMRALWIAGFMQMCSNLVFVLQATVGHHVGMLAVTIGVENLCGGFGTAAFVAYLSALCRREHTATQYALLTALSASAQALLSGGAGEVAARVGWPSFFLITTASALPGMLLLWWLTRRGDGRGGDATPPPASA